MSEYDLLLRGGEVIDPASGRRGRFDVAFSGDRVAAIETAIDPVRCASVQSAEGLLVVPGLIDMHVHVFDGVAGDVAADSVCLRRGATTVADAGSAGANTFDLFRRVAAANRTRTFAWLNLSTIGQVDTRVGELLAMPYADVEAAVRMCERCPEIILGLKARLSTYVVGGTCRPVLRLLREAADAAHLPVMIHVGDTGEPLAEIFQFLKAGDVVSHIFTGRRFGILRGDGRIIPEAFEARKRGIIFDIARGRSHLSFEVLKAVVEQGLLPDSLSTDMTAFGAQDPYFGLPMLATSLLALGVPLEEVVSEMTVGPARALRHPELGRLEPGGVGDATVLRMEGGRFAFQDSDGREMTADRRLVAVGVVRAGDYVAASSL